MAANDIRISQRRSDGDYAYEDIILAATANRVIGISGTPPRLSLFTIGTGVNNLVQLNGSGQLPALDGSLLTGVSTSDMVFSGLGSNLTGKGFRETVTVGENVAFGDLLALKADGSWYKADATSTLAMPALRLALATATTGNTCNVLVYGWARKDAWTWNFGGVSGVIYVSSTAAGALSQTLPTQSGAQVQPVATALSATTLFFCPSLAMAQVL